MHELFTIKLISHPQRRALLKEYVKLKLVTSYNTCHYRHYRQLYMLHRRGWNFFKTAHYLIKMMHYEDRMAKAQLNELLFTLNYIDNVESTRTV